MATPEQRATYLALYRSFVLDTYTSRLDGYSGQTFKVLKALPINAKDTLVSTEVTSGKSGSSSIRVDYRVRSRNGTLKIVDVVVEGISLIATQRSEFASVISRDGFDGRLCRSLRKRVLAEETFRTRATQMKQAIANAGGVQRAAEIAERALTTGQPVHREERVDARDSVQHLPGNGGFRMPQKTCRNPFVDP